MFGIFCQILYSLIWVQVGVSFRCVRVLFHAATSYGFMYWTWNLDQRLGDEQDDL